MPAARIATATASTGHDTRGSGPSAEILRSHGSSRITKASVLSAPAENQNSATHDSLFDDKSLSETHRVIGTSLGVHGPS